VMNAWVPVTIFWFHAPLLTRRAASTVFGHSAHGVGAIDFECSRNPASALVRYSTTRPQLQLHGNYERQRLSFSSVGFDTLLANIGRQSRLGIQCPTGANLSCNIQNCIWPHRQVEFWTLDHITP
jgi:hypothetical protein